MVECHRWGSGRCTAPLSYGLSADAIKHRVRVRIVRAAASVRKAKRYGGERAVAFNGLGVPETLPDQDRKVIPVRATKFSWDRWHG